MLSLLLIGVLAAPTHEHQQREPIRVQIVDETKSDGWLEPGVQDRMDSAQDLANALAQRKEIVLVTDPAAAHLTIRITGRSSHDTGRAQALPVGNTVFFKKLLGRNVSAAVKAGDREFNFIGTTNTRWWSRAATDLAKDIATWAVENRDRILAAYKSQ